MSFFLVVPDVSRPLLLSSFGNPFVVRDSNGLIYPAFSPHSPPIG